MSASLIVVVDSDNKNSVRAVIRCDDKLTVASVDRQLSEVTDDTEIEDVLQAVVPASSFVDYDYIDLADYR